MASLKKENKSSICFLAKLFCPGKSLDVGENRVNVLLRQSRGGFAIRRDVKQHLEQEMVVPGEIPRCFVHLQEFC